MFFFFFLNLLLLSFLVGPIVLTDAGEVGLSFFEQYFKSILIMFIMRAIKCGYHSKIVTLMLGLSYPMYVSGYILFGFLALHFYMFSIQGTKATAI